MNMKKKSWAWAEGSSLDVQSKMTEQSSPPQETLIISLSAFQTNSPKSPFLRFLMGGGGEHGHGEGSHGDFRAKVWTMSGGPYCRPKHWRRNTAISLAGVFLICIPIAMKSAELEQRPHNPVRPIPSQLWCKNFGKKDY